MVPNIVLTNLKLNNYEEKDGFSTARLEYQLPNLLSQRIGLSLRGNYALNDISIKSLTASQSVDFAVLYRRELKDIKTPKFKIADIPNNHFSNSPFPIYQDKNIIDLSLGYNFSLLFFTGEAGYRINSVNIAGRREHIFNLAIGLSI